MMKSVIINIGSVIKILARNHCQLSDQKLVDWLRIIVNLYVINNFKLINCHNLVHLLDCQLGIIYC